MAPTCLFSESAKPLTRKTRNKEPDTELYTSMSRACEAVTREMQ